MTKSKFSFKKVALIVIIVIFYSIGPILIAVALLGNGGLIQTTLLVIAGTIVLGVVCIIHYLIDSFMKLITNSHGRL